MTLCGNSHGLKELIRFMRCQVSEADAYRLNNRVVFCLIFRIYRDVDLVGSCNFHCKLIVSPR